jgi:hypothetical protein
MSCAQDTTVRDGPAAPDLAERRAHSPAVDTAWWICGVGPARGAHDQVTRIGPRFVCLAHTPEETADERHPEETVDELDRSVEEATAALRALLGAVQAAWEPRLGARWRDLAADLEAVCRRALVLGVVDGNRLTVEALLRDRPVETRVRDRWAGECGPAEPPHDPWKRNRRRTGEHAGEGGRGGRVPTLALGDEAVLGKPFVVDHLAAAARPLVGWGAVYSWSA